jgi:hypothetical protein
MTQPPAPIVVGPTLVPDHAVPERAGTRSILAHVTRNGEWTLPRLFRIVAWMGQVDLDLTHVRIGAGVSTIECSSIMGGITILVPHNLRVECHGEPFVGEFSLKFSAPSAAGPDAPLVVVKGSAFMGNVIVKVVDPNAPKWIQRWLKRREKRELPGA